MQGQNYSTQQVEQEDATSVRALYDVDDEGYISSEESEATTIRDYEICLLDPSNHTKQHSASDSANEKLSVLSHIPDPNDLQHLGTGQDHHKRKFSHIDNDSANGRSNSPEGVASSPSNSRRRRTRRRLQRKHLINHHYLQLLNKEIDEFALSSSFLDSFDRHIPYQHQLDGSYIGMVYWSSQEKHIFFEQLGRKSKHNLEAVASCIPTKSLSECFDYLNCLRSARDELMQNEPNLSCRMDEIPSSWEVSQSFLEHEDTCAQNLETWTSISYPQRKPFVLEQTASSLNTDASQYDLKGLSAESANNGSALKSEFEHNGSQSPQSDNEAVMEGEDNSLLNVPKFVELSSRLYFNRPKGTVGERKQHPSIDKLVTSFFDIVTRVITEKLVKACIDVASCRNKLNFVHAGNDDFINQSNLNHIRQTDVWAACQMLHLEPSTPSDFWACLPRRLGLSTVAWNRFKAGRPKPISYEAFEMRLNKYHRRRLAKRAQFLRQEQMNIAQQFLDQEEYGTQSSSAQYEPVDSNSGVSIGNIHELADIDTDDQDFPTETESTPNSTFLSRPNDNSAYKHAQHPFTVGQDIDNSVSDSDLSRKGQKMYQSETDYLEQLDLENSNRYNDITLAWILSGRESNELSSDDDEEHAIHFDGIDADPDIEMPMASETKSESAADPAARDESRIHDNIRLQTIYKLFFGKEVPRLVAKASDDDGGEGQTKTARGGKRQREKQRLRKFMKQWYH